MDPSSNVPAPSQPTDLPRNDTDSKKICDPLYCDAEILDPIIEWTRDRSFARFPLALTHMVIYGSALAFTELFMSCLLCDGTNRQLTSGWNRSLALFPSKSRRAWQSPRSLNHSRVFHDCTRRTPGSCRLHLSRQRGRNGLRFTTLWCAAATRSLYGKSPTHGIASGFGTSLVLGF